MAAVNISAMWSEEAFSAPVLADISWHQIINPATPTVRVSGPGGVGYWSHVQHLHVIFWDI